MLSSFPLPLLTDMWTTPICSKIVHISTAYARTSVQTGLRTQIQRKEADTLGNIIF